MAGRRPKTATAQDITGERGIYLIGLICGEMGFPFQRSGFDKGIDGYLEIVNPTTGESTNNIILVQSKATAGKFTAETEEGFDFYCDERDLDYWMSGNAPVILVRSRPNTNEAYWVSIKDYFKDLSVRKTHKVHFIKSKHRFDASCRDDLMNLAMPRYKGFYIAPPPKPEKLYSNLLTVADFGKKIYIASTEYYSRRTLWGKFRDLSVEPGDDFVLKNKQIMTFRDLNEYPWSEICDVGTIEPFGSAEWAYSKDEERQKDFVELLNRCLRWMLEPDVWYNKNFEYYFFAPTEDNQPRTLPRKGGKGGPGKTVFGPHMKAKEPMEVAYYRHSAFFGQFMRLDDCWYLEITPHYRFTYNGSRETKFHANQLKTIKEFELNPAVFSQVYMWASYLERKSQSDLLTSAYPFLTFGSLASFKVNVGINDKSWLKSEEREKSNKAYSEANQLSLFD
jgi:hypothetical protein